jgi:hypothetical protein
MWSAWQCCAAASALEPVSAEASTMTSEVFVYLMLPGTTQFVTPGRVVLSTDTGAECQKIARAFVYEGLRLPAIRNP